MRVPVVSLVALLLASCASSKPSESARTFPVKHTREFMFEQVKATLAESYLIAEEDPAAGTITTAWTEELAPFNTFGRRDRLKVEIDGDLSEGYRVKATQETEKNTNPINPLSREEADWEATESDGARADKFLVVLFRRLTPREGWRESTIR